MRLVLATRNDHKLRGVPSAAGRLGIEPLPADVVCRPRTAPRTPRTRWSRRAPPRPRSAARRSPTTPASRPLRSAALPASLCALRRSRATDEENLGELPPRRRPAAAALRCAIAHVDPRRRRATFNGNCEGTLSGDARGSGGFGYDPAFLPDDVTDGRTMAELSATEKDAISHRGRAGRALLAWLRDGSADRRAPTPACRRPPTSPAPARAAVRAVQRRRRRLLVALKLGTGLATGSIAFLAEAAHSATDLVAALLTLFAVRVALRPPDREHNYGHGKAEHLAALAESAFLLLVALAIGYESVHRLLTGAGDGVEATWWAFLVLAIVIAIDVSRAVASGRTARRHGSPALAANAIHFTSDLAGSLAVLAGTILVATGHPKGDAIAGLAVAVLVVAWPCGFMWQSVEVLMDRTSAGAETRIRAALAGLREPLELRRVRARDAAGRDFADLVLGVGPTPRPGSRRRRQRRAR